MSAKAPTKSVFTMDAALLKKCLEDGTFVMFDPSIYEDTNIKIREYPDGSKTYGNSKIVTQADKNGKRYMFNYSGCAVIALYENAPVSKLTNKNAGEARVTGNIIDTHLGLRSPAAVVEYMLTLGSWTKDLDFENIGRTLPQDADSMLDHEHIFTLGTTLEIGIVVEKLDDKNKLLERVKVVDGHHTVTIRLKNFHYQNSGDQASF